jgi:hypothetical protein
MTNRRGPNSYDCSSAQYYSLIQGGYLPVGIYIGNTDSLFGDLEKYGWQQIQPNSQGNYDTQRNDIFIWGRRGASSGAIGHTGRFIDANNVIHCNAYFNGISINDYDGLQAANGWPTATYYRYVGGQVITPEPVDQVVNPGSYIQFGTIYRVDDVQQYAGLWQVRTDVLCPVGFTWADNGIPAGPLFEVDADGYRSDDQVLEVGSCYVLPGKYQVLDVGQSNGRWLAQIMIDGFKFWIDLETVTEVGPNDPGVPTPPSRPQVTTTTTTLEKPSEPISTTTTTAPIGVTTTEPVTTTTTAPVPPTSTTTTSIPDDALEGIDLEGNATTTTTTTTTAYQLPVGFWAAFWLGVKQTLTAILRRLQGR